ncbi:MAG: GNAT family N-acetyltransferase [Planctomycetota bacterium]|nr:MAG: GNAT family N-acetyltransferase [Planctomycetota bacterium]
MFPGGTAAAENQTGFSAIRSAHPSPRNNRMSLVLNTLRVATAVERQLSRQVLVRRFSPHQDRAALEILSRACNDIGGDLHGPTANLPAVLATRPGRDVHAWLAMDAVAGKEASVLGFVALIVAATRHSIGWLLVHPAARRRGVGTALVDRVIAEAALLGARDVYAETLRRWPAAMAFWERMAERHS